MSPEIDRKLEGLLPYSKDPRNQFHPLARRIAEIAVDSRVYVSEKGRYKHPFVGKIVGLKETSQVGNPMVEVSPEGYGEFTVYLGAGTAAVVLR